MSAYISIAALIFSGDRSGLAARVIFSMSFVTMECRRRKRAECGEICTLRSTWRGMETSYGSVSEELPEETGSNG